MVDHALGAFTNRQKDARQIDVDNGLESIQCHFFGNLTAFPVRGHHHPIFYNTGKRCNKIDLPERLNGGISQAGTIFLFGDIAGDRNDITAHPLEFRFRLLQQLFSHVGNNDFAAIFYPMLSQRQSDAATTAGDYRYRIFNLQHIATYSSSSI
ncbi:conserved hypothetical protein [Desulfosarcina cetonica]|nr:conserved hypothetical protein [Desulfosarcina cetonica]